MKAWFIRLPQPVKFAAIGLLNTGVDFSLFFTFTSVIGLPIYLSNIISTSAALCLSYLLNAALTFQSTKTTRRTALFFAVTISGLWALQPIVIHTVLVILRAAPDSISYELLLLSAKIAATAASLVWNFLLYKYLVFRPVKPSAR